MPRNQETLITLARDTYFLKLLERSTKLDIASAYVSYGNIWKTILQKARAGKVRVRIIAGIDGAITDPRVLETKEPRIDVKVSNYSSLHGGKFHTKLYIFTIEGRKEALLGSANLTNHGFSENEEILWNIKEEKKVEELEKYFKDLWENQNKATFLNEEQLEGYREQHKKRKKIREEEKCFNENLWHLRKKNADAIATASAEDGPFSEYCSLLLQVARARFCEDMEDPDDKIRGVISALQECHKLLEFCAAPFDEDDAHMLLGTSGDYAYLGNFSRSPVNTYFKHHTEEGRKIRETLRQFTKKKNLTSMERKVRAVQECLESLTNVDGIGLATASRLMTVARPDLVISFNSASRQRLEELSDCPHCSLERKYLHILQWIWQKSWYNSQPDCLNGLMVKIWENRAALLDFLVYDLHSEDPLPLERKVKRFLR